MKTKIASEEIYSKYFALEDKTVEVILKDNRRLKGIFVGFFKDDLESSDSRIIKWQFVEDTSDNCFGVDSLGFLVGEIISQKDIIEIRFMGDGSVLKFE